MAWKVKHGNAWKIKGRLDGKQVTYETLYGDDEEAELRVGHFTQQEKEAKLGFRRKGSSPLVRVGAGPKFEEWAPEYLEWYALTFPQTFKKTSDHFRILHKYFGQLKIAEGQEDRWKDAWHDMEMELGPKHKGSTLSGYFKTLSAAMHRAAQKGGTKKRTKRWRLVTLSPVADLAYLREDGETERHHFSDDELEAIYKTDPKDAPIWRLMACTGLRRREVCNQLTANVEREQIRVSHNPNKGHHVKSKKGRVIPLSPGAQDARDRILFEHDGSEFFFRRQHHDTWTEQFSRVLHKADIQEGSLHSLRHTFITMAANNPAISINNVRKWAGHSKLETTLGYIHDVAGEEQRQIASLSL